MIRLQLIGPDRHLLTPEQYDQFFSTHGMTMIFLYASPILSGFSNYLFPLFLGSRDMAFPRLNALSYWIYLASALFLYAGFVIGAGPNDGWFNYVPYASREYNPGLNMDFYALGMILLGISTSVGAANFIVTVFRCRAPGMSINRMPVIIWGTLTASVANLVVIPAVSLAFFLLWLDRQFGTHFFDAGGGGQPLLWQHLFWMFGHPWVYAIVLPAMGMVSDGLPVFCRHPLVGYTAVALATVAHDDPRLRRVGAPHVRHRPAGPQPLLLLRRVHPDRDPQRGRRLRLAGDDLDGAAGDDDCVPLLRLDDPAVRHRRRVRLHDGERAGRLAADRHLLRRRAIHYVLIGINVFPVIGATYFWFPKMTGRLMDERLGRWNFWTMFTASTSPSCRCT